MLDALEVDEGILPRVVESTEVSGSVTTEAAKELGVSAGIPVVGGGADNAAGAVGCGATNNTVLQASIGTSGAVVSPVSQPHVAEDMNLHTFCHAAPDMWYLMGVVLSAGSFTALAARHDCPRNILRLANGRGGKSSSGERRLAISAIPQRRAHTSQ